MPEDLVPADVRGQADRFRARLRMKLESTLLPPRPGTLTDRRLELAGVAVAWLAGVADCWTRDDRCAEEAAVAQRALAVLLALVPDLVDEVIAAAAAAPAEDPDDRCTCGHPDCGAC